MRPQLACCGFSKVRLFTTTANRRALHREATLIQTGLKANFALNVIGMTLPAGVALITVPIYFAHIGEERYGILSIVWILLGYFGFLDFGLSRAAANALARLTHRSAERMRVFATALYLNLVLGVVGAFVIYFAGNYMLGHMLKMSNNLGAELQGVFSWIACMLPLALVAAVGRGSIEAREQFLAVNLLDLAGVLLGQVVPLLFAVFVAPTLTIVIPAAFAARVISVALIFVFIMRTEGIVTLRAFDRGRIRELVGFGVWVSVTNVIGPILTSVDQIFVGSTLGAAAVAHYSVPMNLVNRSQIVAAALARTLFPRFSRLAAGEAMKLAERTAVSLAYTFAAICGPAIIVGNAFLILWIGATFATYAGPILQILMIGAWINGVSFIPFSLLQGQGRPDLVAKIHTLEFVPFIAVLWFLLQEFGLPGAALAWVLRVTVDALLLFGAAKFRFSHLTRITPALVLMAVSYAVAQIVAESIIWSVVLAGAMALLTAGAAFVFDSTSRQIFWKLRGRIIEATS
jgi:O-antigen/teichoic acid export membrane protein